MVGSTALATVPADEETTVHVAIMLFDGVEELDWAGPWEVLTMWGALERRAARDGRRRTVDLRVETIGDSPGPVQCAKGARVLADRAWDDLGDETPDVVIVPGGRGTRTLVEDQVLLGQLRTLHRDGAMLVSVCTGALLLAAAGLLEGRPATTHHGALAELQGLDGSIDVRRDVRWVDDGDVVTAAGVSAGIDVALHLVDRLAGTEVARAVRDAMQYDPEPPV